jgi:hypothetical protein
VSGEAFGVYIDENVEPINKDDPDAVRKVEK